MKYADRIPYQFVLDHLGGADLVIKPMFGCYGIYANGKLCLFPLDRERPLVRREAEPMQKGVYIATAAEFVDSLRSPFSNAEFEILKQGKVWIFVSKELAEFEDYVIAACELIAKGDQRIGR